VNHSTYYRLILSEILPDYVDTVLYLDSDTIIDGDITPIFNLNFDKKTHIYASEHLFKPEQKIHLRNFGLSEYDYYFNAGVLFIDLKKWRNENISEKLMDFANKRYNDILWWDQDVLNVFFYKKWKRLHPKYNVIWEVLEANSDDSMINEAKKNPIIVHYTRSVKPWHNNSYHPLKHLYWEYRKKLPDSLLEALI
jgi:lipopolysaccharide biosynthesis glycosyltransferase